MVMQVLTQMLFRQVCEIFRLQYEQGQTQQYHAARAESDTAVPCRPGNVQAGQFFDIQVDQQEDSPRTYHSSLYLFSSQPDNTQLSHRAYSEYLANEL